MTMTSQHPSTTEQAPNQPDPPPGVTERRQYTRIQLVADVDFESDSNFFTGFTEDISEGGLFLATYELQPIGTSIDMKFSLPDGHVVEAVADVRWLRDPRDKDQTDARPGMGLQFRELSAEDREAIQQFIATRAPLFYED